jgi:ornithine cyclodeaminase/alanine dehydrogenase-like protein (mu-crystallin family)
MEEADLAAVRTAALSGLSTDQMAALSSQLAAYRTTGRIA